MRTILQALEFFRADKLRVGCWFAIIAASVLLGLLQAWPTAVLVDAVLTRNPHVGFFHQLFLFFLPNDMLQQVIGITLIGMGMKFTQDLLQWSRKVLSKRIEVNGIRRARARLYDQLQLLGPAYQKTQPAGDSVYRVSNDVAGLAVVLNVLVDVVVSCMTLGIMIAIMLTRSVPLTIFAMSVLPLLLLANAFFAPRVKNATSMAKAAEAGLNNSLIRSINGLSLVQLFGRARHESRRFDDSASSCAEGWQALNKYEAWYAFAVQTVFSLGGAIIFGYGGYLAYRDQFANPIANGFTVGDIMVFMAYLGALWDPLSRITGAGVNIKPGIVGVQRLLAVLNTPVSTPEAHDARALTVQPRTLELNAVTMRYPGRTDDALSNVSLQVAPGKFVGIVGASGSGKSTLLNLLPRFYDPAGGTITLDEQELRRLKLEDVRAHFAFASQDTTLLPGTVRENILYGCIEADDNAMHEAAARAGAHDFITSLPLGYDTEVGENGGILSGGQRQRIALARALLNRAPILVLDEPTSALDTTHEQLVLQAIDQERQRRTVILVTHRLPAVKNCDQIVLIDAGQIIDRGTHDEMVARDGPYARLVRQHV
jgi:ATP-binding cassette subfamily B protein